MPVPPRLRRLLTAALPAVAAVTFTACNASYPNSIFHSHTDFNRDVGVLWSDIGSGVLTRLVRHKWKIGVAPLCLVCDQPIDRRSGGDGDGDPFTQIDRSPVPGGEE